MPPGTWPVAPKLVEDFAGCHSIYAAAKHARWQHRCTMVHKDNVTEIPQARKFSRRLSCGQLHPGLCFTEDGVLRKMAGTALFVPTVRQAAPIRRSGPKSHLT